MKIRSLLRAASALYALAAVANAASLTGSSPGYHYFWKAGATIEEHDAAVIDCAVRLRAMVNGSDAMTAITASTGGGLAGALIGGIIDNNENRQGDAASMEGCMAIKGWSVVSFSGAEGEAVRDLDDATLIGARLATLVGAPEAPGTVLRAPFANELAAGPFVIEAARDLDKVSLSVRATKLAAEAAIEAAGKLKPATPTLPKGVKPPKAVGGSKATEFAGADPAKAYVALRVTGGGLEINGMTVTLSRLAADGTEIVHDGASVTAFLGYLKGRRFQRVEDSAGKHNDHVVEVPPGLWKVSTITQGAFDADLCFGAPAFHLAAGETIFLGEMTIADTGGYPLDASTLETARSILAANPAIADRAKAPEWTNGFTSDCFGSYAYAYEIPGAPVVDMDALKRAGESPAPVTTPSGDAPVQ